MKRFVERAVSTFETFVLLPRGSLGMRPTTAQHTSPSSSALFVGVEEAASALGVSRSLAYAMANLWLAGGEDGLPAIRLGRRILIRRATLDEWASTDAVASRSVRY